MQQFHLDMKNTLEVVFILIWSFSMYAVTPNSQERPTTADQFSKLCPYTAQCHRNATKLLLDDLPVKACCTPCSCHDDCLAMGNCCPDKRKALLKPVQFSCKETVVKRAYDNTNIVEEVYRGHDSGIKRYFIINKCPDKETNAGIANLCTGTKHNCRKLKHFIWVSDLDSGRIFQNEYCAKCHGATNIIQWQVMTTCFDILLANISTALTTVLSDQCSIIAVAPETITDVTEKYLCFLPEYSRCNETGLWDKHDEELEQACLEYTSTYFYPTFFGYDIYKNVFCYVCNQRHETRTMSICSLLENDIASVNTPFTALLDYNRYKQPIRVEEECGIGEIMDKFKKICRILICPFPRTPFYGTCIQLSRYVLGLKVQINFKLTVLGNCTESNLNVSESEIGQAVDNAFSESFGLQEANCPICYTIVLRDDKYESFQLYLLTMVYTTPRCQYDRITELVSAVVAKKLKATLPDKTYLPIRVTIDSRREEKILSSSKVIHERNAKFCDIFPQYHVRSGLFCSQIEINDSEMSSLEGSRNIFQRMLNEDCKTEKVSNDSFRICVDDYYSALDQTSSGYRFLLTQSSLIGCCFVLGFFL